MDTWADVYKESPPASAGGKKRENGARRGGKGDGNMTEQTGDRRSRRSRKLLKQGLLELLREKRFANISVRDITERMDLNRGTFYLHYPDTTALMRSVEEDILGEVRQLVDAHLQESVENGTLRPVFEPVLEYVVANRETCAALFDNNSSSSLLEQMQKLIGDYGTDLLQAFYHTEGPERYAYFLSFISYGLAGLMKEWFDRDMVLPKETLADTAEHLVTSAAQAMLG